MEIRHSECAEEGLHTKRLMDSEDDVSCKISNSLKLFLENSSKDEGFTYEKLIILWKGIYCDLHFADIHSIQKVFEEIGSFLHHLSNNSQILLFFKATLETVVGEWDENDELKKENFLLLITGILGHTLNVLTRIPCEEDEIKQFGELLETSAVYPSDITNGKPLQLKLHFSKIIVKELLKVREKISESFIIATLLPFFKVLTFSNDSQYAQAIQEHILETIIKQGKLNLRQNGILKKAIKLTVETGDDSMEGIEVIKHNNDGNQEIALDKDNKPHSAILELNYGNVAEALLSVASLPEVSCKNKEKINRYANLFLTLSKGRYPAQCRRANEIARKRKFIMTAVEDLMAFRNPNLSLKRKLEDGNEENEEKKRRKEPVVKSKKEKRRERVKRLIKRKRNRRKGKKSSISKNRRK